MSEKIKYSPQLKYEGELRLSIVDKDNRVITLSNHNAGTNELFEFLAACMCGYNVSSSSPKKLDILDDDNVSLIYSQNKISLRDAKYAYDSTDGWCAVLRFTINRDQVRDPSGEKIKFELLGGLNSEGVFAEVDNLQSAIISQLVPGTTLYVEWLMKVSNGD